MINNLSNKAESLLQSFSAFLLLQPFNSVLQVVVTLTMNLFLLVVRNYNFATAMNSNINSFGDRFANEIETQIQRICQDTLICLHLIV